MSSSAKSSIWCYFQLLQTDNKYAVCNLCGSKISRGGNSHTTTPLWTHLKKKHPSVYKFDKGDPHPRSQSVQEELEVQVEDVDDPESANAVPCPVSSPGFDGPLSQLNSAIRSPQAANSGHSRDSTDSDDTASVISDSSHMSLSPLIPLPSSSNAQFKPPPKRKAVIPAGQHTLKSFIDKTQSFKPGDKRSSMITRLIGEMISLDNQPMSIVENKGFRKLINHLESRYTIPSRKHFATKVIPDLYDETKKKTEKLLSEAKYIALTTDMWTSTATDDYISLTAHFLDSSEAYRHVCLECVPFLELSHSGANIRDFIVQTIEDWGMSDKIVCIVRDNGRNIVSALEGSPFEHISCLAHTLQLVIKDGILNKQMVKDLAAKCRGIVGHFKHSSKATKQLKIAQIQLNVKQHKLIQDEPTRWNSLLHMMRRILEQKQAVTLAASNLSFNVDITPLQWNVIKQLIDILDVFDRATFVASGSTVTISEVIPLVNSIINMLENTKYPHSHLQSFINDLLFSIKSRYQFLEKEKLYTFATMLDPRFKINVFHDEKNIETMKNQLASEMTALPEVFNPMQTEGLKKEAQTREADERHQHSMWGYYSKLMVSAPGSGRKSWGTPEEEIQRYLQESLLPPSGNIFDYWKTNNVYPRLKELSSKYLITPPSTVFSDRLFSTSGLICDKKRSRLDPERVQMLVFLNKNLQ